jgi:hypothetical protein
MTTDEERPEPPPLTPEEAEAQERRMNRITPLLVLLGSVVHCAAFMLRTVEGSKGTSFVIGCPWGLFAVIDNEHDDHWSGGYVQDSGEVMPLPECMPLHEVLRLQITFLINERMEEMTKDLDKVPPKTHLH